MKPNIKWTEKTEAAPVSGQHTPTPWVYGDAKGTLCAYRVVEPNERQRTIAFVAHTGSNAQDKSNAEFIVRACNCHDELVQALQDLLAADQMPPCEKQADLAIVAMKQARAALNKASR